MKSAYVLTFRFPKKIAHFIQQLKMSGLDIDSILIISKEILGNINGYYALNITKKELHRDSRKTLLIFPKKEYPVRKSLKW